jgi:DNA repair protein RadC
LAIPRRDTKSLAKRLLSEFGSFPAVLAASSAELERVEGLSAGAAAAMKFIEAASLRSLRAAAIDRPVLAGWQAGRR